MKPQENTWHGHVCGAVREEGKIRVRTKRFFGDGFQATETVRHCRDTLACIEGAKVFSFVLGTGGARWQDPT
jgi:hypothetical protein